MHCGSKGKCIAGARGSALREQGTEGLGVEALGIRIRFLNFSYGFYVF